MRIALYKMCVNILRKKQAKNFACVFHDFGAIMGSRTARGAWRVGARSMPLNIESVRVIVFVHLITSATRNASFLIAILKFIFGGSLIPYERGTAC